MRAVGEDADEVELAQALLRLAPDGRDAALAAADDLPGRAGAIVRCALGGPEVPDDGAAALAARASREPPLTWVSIEVDGVELARQPSGALEGPLGECLVTATGENEPHGRFANDPLAWPLRRDILCAGLFWAVAFNLGRGAPEYHAAARYLELLTREGEPLPPLALTLTIRALCSSSAPEHLSAADLLIAAIDDGRVDAPARVPILREELPRVMANRLGPRLADVAGAGPLQRAVVRDVLDATVDAMAALPPRTYGALLVPFDELSAQTGTRVQASRAFLQTLKGSSAAAKAARSLLAREGAAPEEERRLALAARLRRAERWADA